MRPIAVVAMALSFSAACGALAAWSAATTREAGAGAGSGTDHAAEAAADSTAPVAGAGTPAADSSSSGSSGAGADSTSQPGSVPDDTTKAEAAKADAKPATKPAAKPGGDPVAGKKIFREKCVACHKADGTGGIKLTGNPTPNWRDAKRMADPKYDDAYLRDCITNGKLKSGMVAWSKQGVKPAQIENLIAYIRTLAAAKK